MHDAAATGFQRSAAAYERGRPGYPPDAVRWLGDELRLQPGCTVVDVAAGTGKLTRMLLATGATVVAVEPVLAMCAVLRAVVPGVAVVAGTAEALPLGARSADAVTVAQAFHWLHGPSALTGFHRVIRPGGRLALVWNRRDLDDLVHQEVSRIIDPHRGVTPSHHGERWRSALRQTRRFQLSAETAFANRQVVDAEGLVDRVVSTSFIAALPTAELERVTTAVRALAARHGGRVVLPYRTEIQVFTRSGERSTTA